jgi:hypothetical protein
VEDPVPVAYPGFGEFAVAAGLGAKLLLTRGKGGKERSLINW